MIDLVMEKAISLRDAAKMVPSAHAGRPTHVSCIQRWITDGAMSVDGQRRVHLEAIRLGTRWCTSAAALRRFAAELARTEGGHNQLGDVGAQHAAGTTGR